MIYWQLRCRQRATHFGARKGLLISWLLDRNRSMTPLRKTEMRSGSTVCGANLKTFTQAAACLDHEVPRQKTRRHA